MATQTATQRQAAAKKAAATRKRNSAKQSGRSASASARRTQSSARSTARSAKRTAKTTARTTARRVDAETTRLEALGRQAERTVLIPIGAGLEAWDRVTDTVRTYSNGRRATQRLNRFERRGATALRRGRRSVEREAKEVRRDLDRGVNGLQSEADDVVQRIRNVA